MPDISRFTIGTGSNAIEFQIMANEPFTYENGETGPARTVTYRVDKGLGSKGADALYGIGVYAFTTTGSFSYQNPHRFPGNTALTVHGVWGRPMGIKMPNPQLMTGTYELITANYAVNYFDTDGSEYTTTGLADKEVPWSRLTRRGTSEDHAIRKDKIQVAGTTIEPEQNFNLKVPVQEYVWERGMLPSFPDFDAILQGLEGRMNSAPFFGFPAKTLFLDSSDSEIMMDASGARKMRFSMVIRHRMYPWDRVPDPEDPYTWVPIETQASSNPVIPSANFQPLIDYGVV